MNTRGLTGIVILSVGLQLRILDQSLYSLMIVMAIVTTMMAGPLLRLIYPDRYVERDIAEADRAALGTPAGHRILVLIEAPETAAPLVDIGVALAASREHSQLILCQLAAPEHDTRLEVATGLGGELRETTRTTGNLQALADRASARGVPAVMSARFSQDLAELPGYVAAAKADTIVLGPGRTFRETLAADGAVQLVTVVRSLPEAPGAVAARWTRGEGGAAVVLVAAQLAVAGGLKLVISPAGGRRASLAAGLTRDGIAASDGPPPSGAIVVAAAADSSGDAHLTVRAGTREASADLDQWVQDLGGSRLIGQR
jgi:K+:H+ antiporter